MKIYLWIIGTLFLLAIHLPAKAKSGGTKENTLVFTSDQGDLRIQLCTDGMFRVTKSKDKTFAVDETWMVVKYSFDKVDYQQLKDGNIDIVKTAKLSIAIQPNPWRIQVKDHKGQVLYNEIDSKVVGEPSNECTMQPDEHFFGFGERMDQLDQRGQKVHLNVELGKGPRPAVGGKDILRANYCPVPWFISSKGYGIFFHTANPTDWDMGWTNKKSYTYSANGGELDYYFIFGPAVENMLQGYQTLTGNCPMMPRSAYGLHVGSYSGGTWKYEECTSDQYPIDLVHRLRQEKIPFDLLWLDSTWRIFNERFGNGGCCFEFRSNFKDPQAMIDSIYANHVDMFGLHIRAIVDDGGKDNMLFQNALKTGYVLYPQADCEGVVNFFEEKAADWWWKNGAMRIAKMGVKFVKTDCGGTLRFPPETTFDKGFTADQLHNLFPIPYAKVPYEKFQAYNNQRGFNHTREGYAGIQRYPFIWAGDWGSEWQWFEPVIRGGLNIGLSGVGYWSHCMGGFEQYSPHDTDLYVRWCQFGMFSPVSILFGMDHPRYHEPWTYGKEAMEIFIKYDNLRYSLIPYIYSNAYNMYKTSRPLMTPLLYDWMDDELTYRISDQFMFGKSLMICPVVNKGALSRPVYFPGGKWIDFWTGERIDGRQNKSFLTPPDLMPIFVREGAIIPKQPVVQYLTGAAPQEITLLVYPSGESSYNLYEDDGRSLDYQKGICGISTIHSSLIGTQWTLTIGKPQGAFVPSRHTYHVEAYMDIKPQNVTVNGSILGEDFWNWDEDLKLLKINTNVDNRSDIILKVQ